METGTKYAKGKTANERGYGDCGQLYLPKNCKSLDCCWKEVHSS